MIKNIVKDPIILLQKSKDATIMDMQTIIDLKDTFLAHRNDCVGMAANMIGEQKKIIIFDYLGSYKVMLNPEIIDMKDKYIAEEGCLSLSGLRKTERYNRIEVKYYDEKFHISKEKYEGWTAQIIQHEIDHCNGVLI